MKTRINRRIALMMTLMLLAAGWVVFSYQQSMRPVGGTPASVVRDGAGKMLEDFALNDENGKTVHLSDYKGQIVALVFYASW